MKPLFILSLMLGLTSCQPSLDHQPKIKVYAENTPPPVTDAFTYIKDGVKENQRPEVSIRNLKRGQERYQIFCKVCHGVLGDGNGIVTLHGFSPPPSFHTSVAKKITDQEMFDIITNGKDRMTRMGDRISEPDRWNIIGYVRSLQKSQSPPKRGGKK